MSHEKCTKGCGDDGVCDDCKDDRAWNLPPKNTYKIKVRVSKISRGLPTAYDDAYDLSQGLGSID